MPRTPANRSGLTRTVHRHPDADAGPWVVTLEWVEMDGRPEVAAIAITRDGQVAPMPAALLRQVPFADWVAADRAEMMPTVEATGGMRKSAADRLRETAVVYERALGEGGRPTKAVAEHFGISQGGASNLVARARAAGLLPPTSAGKAAGGAGVWRRVDGSASRMLSVMAVLGALAWEFAREHPEIVGPLVLRRWM